MGRTVMAAPALGAALVLGSPALAGSGFTSDPGNAYLDARVTFADASGSGMRLDELVDTGIDPVVLLNEGECGISSFKGQLVSSGDITDCFSRPAVAAEMLPNGAVVARGILTATTAFTVEDESERRSNTPIYAGLGGGAMLAAGLGAFFIRRRFA